MAPPTALAMARSGDRGKGKGKGKAVTGGAGTAVAGAPSSSATAAARSTAARAGKGSAPSVHFVPDLPYELLLMILSFAARSADARPLTFLLLNKRVSQDLWPHVYRRITLSSYASLDSFSSLLLNKPDVRRYVKALWIGPRGLQSDLLRALAPDDVQLSHERSACSLVVRRTHNILRSCRHVQTLALSGKLLSMEPAKSYGKACKPVEVWAVNPYSFVTYYLADILERTEVLQLFDLTLAQEECATIVRMPRLRHFLWTTPSSASTSTLSSAAYNMGRSLASYNNADAGGAPPKHQHHPPREAALLWRLLLLSNPYTENRKTRPPLRATFAAGAELVSEVEASLCPLPLPPASSLPPRNGRKGRRRRRRLDAPGMKDGAQRDGRRGGGRMLENGSTSTHDGGDSLSTRASLGGHSNGDGHLDTLITSSEDEGGTDDGESASGSQSEGEEDDDDGDEDDSGSERPAFDTSSSSQNHYNGYENGTSTYLAATSATARAEALEASFRSLAFSAGGGGGGGASDDLAPPPLFLYQPTPSGSSSGHGSGSSMPHHHHHYYHQQHQPSIRAEDSISEAHGGQLAEPTGDEPGEVDPDAELNAVSFDIPAPTHHGRGTSAAAGSSSSSSSSSSRRTAVRAPSLSSLASTQASTHGHSSHSHVHAGTSRRRRHLAPSSSSSSSAAAAYNTGSTNTVQVDSSTAAAAPRPVYRPTLDDIDAPRRLRTGTVPVRMVLEWEALRDRVCPVHPPVSPLASTTMFASGSGSGSGSAAAAAGPPSSHYLYPPAGSGRGGEGPAAASSSLDGGGPEKQGEGGEGADGEDEVEPGNALMRIWRLWVEATDV